MFGIFKKQSQKEKLEKQYRQLMEQAHKYAATNRKLSDEKVFEAEQVMQAIEQLVKSEK